MLVFSNYPSLNISYNKYFSHFYSIIRYIESLVSTKKS